MHRAPAVNFTVKRSRWQARLIVLLSLLIAAILTIFVHEQAVFGMQAVFLTLSVVLAGSTAYLGWRRSPQGNLRWDGQHWFWSGFAKETVCRLDLLMDFQSFLVVTIMAEGQAPVFLWLEATLDGSNWMPLRRAIVSSQAPSGGKNRKARHGVEEDLL